MSEIKPRGALSIIDLHKYLGEQIKQILDDDDSPDRYTVEVREHYLVRPPEHCTRDRRDGVVFLVGLF